MIFAKPAAKSTFSPSLTAKPNFHQWRSLKFFVPEKNFAAPTRDILEPASRCIKRIHTDSAKFIRLALTKITLFVVRVKKRKTTSYSRRKRWHPVFKST